jgi:hypothetical protein
MVRLVKEEGSYKNLEVAVDMEKEDMCSCDCNLDQEEAAAVVADGILVG